MDFLFYFWTVPHQVIIINLLSRIKYHDFIITKFLSRISFHEFAIMNLLNYIIAYAHKYRHICIIVDYHIYERSVQYDMSIHHCSTCYHLNFCYSSRLGTISVNINVSIMNNITYLCIAAINSTKIFASGRPVATVTPSQSEATTSFTQSAATST